MNNEVPIPTMPTKIMTKSEFYNHLARLNKLDMHRHTFLRKLPKVLGYYGRELKEYNRRQFLKISEMRQFVQEYLE